MHACRTERLFHVDLHHFPSVDLLVETAAHMLQGETEAEHAFDFGGRGGSLGPAPAFARRGFAPRNSARRAFARRAFARALRQEGLAAESDTNVLPLRGRR